MKNLTKKLAKAGIEIEGFFFIFEQGQEEDGWVTWSGKLAKTLEKNERDKIAKEFGLDPSVLSKHDIVGLFDKTLENKDSDLPLLAPLKFSSKALFALLELDNKDVVKLWGRDGQVVEQKYRSDVDQFIKLNKLSKDRMEHSACDCGAKKTSNPNLHANWCTTQTALASLKKILAKAGFKAKVHRK